MRRHVSKINNLYVTILKWHYYTQLFLDDPSSDRRMNLTRYWQRGYYLSNTKKCWLKWVAVNNMTVPKEAQVFTRYQWYKNDEYPLCRYRIHGPVWSREAPVIVPGIVVPRHGMHCSTPQNFSKNEFNIEYEVLIAEEPFANLTIEVEHLTFDDSPIEINKTVFETPQIAASIRIKNSGRSELKETLSFTRTVVVGDETFWEDTYEYLPLDTDGVSFSAQASQVLQTGPVTQYRRRTKTKDIYHSNSISKTEKQISHSTEIVAAPGENLIATAYLFTRTKVTNFTATMVVRDSRGQTGAAILEHLKKTGFTNQVVVGEDYIRYTIKGSVKADQFLGIYTEVRPAVGSGQRVLRFTPVNTPKPTFPPTP